MSELNHFDRFIHAAQHFQLEGNIVSIQAFGSGHINDTLRVDTDHPNGKCYLLQRINIHVFPDVDVLMKNILLVTEHLKKKVQHCSDHEQRVLTLIKTTDHQLYYKDEAGDCWRMFILIEGTKSYDIVETALQAFEGGRAFGLFQKQLADLDVHQIKEVLPDFHNIRVRLANFRKAVQQNVADRVDLVQDLIAYIEARADKMHSILDMANDGLLPLRITHNDTKFNNILLDKQDKVQCVIDLDTVMPGYVAYDFGDAIRTIINPVAEDEKDIDKIVLNLHLYEAYTDGYLAEAGEFLTDDEVKSLLEGALLFPYMQAVRFLTDYLEGDHYFKTKYEDHNLVRTKTQLKLVHEMEKNHETMRETIYKHLSSNV